MNTINLTLCASTRTGCLSAPIHSCADERLTLAGDLTLSAGTSVALITPRGNTLAHTILSEECAPGATIPLSTLTAQAAEYTRSCRAGDTREALLAIGDSEHPIALIPARIAQNPLYTLAPPADLAPAYPTTETLQALLAEMQAASNAAAQSATAARNSATEAGESASSAASDRATAVYSATSSQAYAEVATAAQARASTSAAEASTSAANAASSAASARDAAYSAISAANSAAGSASKAAASADSAASALTASTNAANRAEVAAEKAREADISAANSATAASQSATTAAQEAADGVTALLQGKVDAAEAAKAGAEAAKTAAETAKAGADAAKSAAASSATAAANSATAASQSATEAASQVTDTLKRINFCNGKFYSQYYNANSRSITWNEKNFFNVCLMAWNDRYIIITDALKVGWIVVNGSDFSFISSSPYHHSLYLYHHSTFKSLGFNGSRVAIFYRFNEYKEGGTTCNYAEVLDANTGDVLIEKTYTAEEMAFIKAAPCFGMGFTCILKNGDMIHSGTIFSGEDLSIKGYVAAEDGFAVVSGTYSTYCCYLTANADNSYSGEDPIIVQSNDTYSFWVDDRYTLGEDGEPIVTLRNFHVDGIFNETNSNTRIVAALFSVYSSGWGGIIHVAAVRNSMTGKISLHNVSLDSTNDNIIKFSGGYEIDYAKNIYDLVPVNFFTGNLIYAQVPFYVVRGALVYAVKGSSIASSPCIALQAYDNNTRTTDPYYLPSVAYTNVNHSRPIPVSRFFENNSSLIYPVENI